MVPVPAQPVQKNNFEHYTEKRLCTDRANASPSIRQGQTSIARTLPSIRLNVSAMLDPIHQLFVYQLGSQERERAPKRCPNGVSFS